MYLEKFSKKKLEVYPVDNYESDIRFLKFKMINPFSTYIKNFIDFQKFYYSETFLFFTKLKIWLISINVENSTWRVARARASVLRWGSYLNKARFHCRNTFFLKDKVKSTRKSCMLHCTCLCWNNRIYIYIYIPSVPDALGLRVTPHYQRLSRYDNDHAA